MRFVPMRKLTGGVLHSKFWVVDGRHIYLGSANMDWRALTQVSVEPRGGGPTWSSSTARVPGGLGLMSLRPWPQHGGHIRLEHIIGAWSGSHGIRHATALTPWNVG